MLNEASKLSIFSVCCSTVKCGFFIFDANMSVSLTVKKGMSDTTCGTRASLIFSNFEVTVTSPEVGTSRPDMLFSSVVFPAPLGPKLPCVKRFRFDSRLTEQCEKVSISDTAALNAQDLLVSYVIHEIVPP